MVWHHRDPRLLRTRGSARLRIVRRTTWTVLVGSLVGFAVLVGSPMDDGLRLLRDLILYNLVHLAAACLCWWPSAATRSSVRAWRLLAVATVFATAGNVCATLTPGASGLLTSDAQRRAAPGLLSRREHRRDAAGARPPPPAGTRRVARRADGRLASAAVAAALVLAPMLRRDPSTSAQAITHLAYPVADLTLADRADRARHRRRGHPAAGRSPAGAAGGGAGPAPGHRPHLPPARPGRATTGTADPSPWAGCRRLPCSRRRPVTARRPVTPTATPPPGRSNAEHHGTDAGRTRRPRRPDGRMPHHPPPGRGRARRRLSAHRPAPHRADPPPTAGPARSAPGGAHRPADRPGQPTPSPGALHRPARSTRRRTGQPADDRPRRLQDRQRPPRPPRRRPRPRPGRRPPRRGHPRPRTCSGASAATSSSPSYPTPHPARPSSSPNGCRPSWPHRSPSQATRSTSARASASAPPPDPARPPPPVPRRRHRDVPGQEHPHRHDGRRDHREQRQPHPPRHPRQELHTVLIPAHVCPASPRSRPALSRRPSLHRPLRYPLLRGRRSPRWRRLVAGFTGGAPARRGLPQRRLERPTERLLGHATHLRRDLADGAPGGREQAGGEVGPPPGEVAHRGCPRGSSKRPIRPRSGRDDGLRQVGHCPVAGGVLVQQAGGGPTTYSKPRRADHRVA